MLNVIYADTNLGHTYYILHTILVCVTVFIAVAVAIYWKDIELYVHFADRLQRFKVQEFYG